MKIEKQGAVRFCDVKPGQVFGYHDYILMRTRAILTPDSEAKIIANSVDLVTGTYILIKDTEEATIYENAKVVIE